MRRAGDTVVTTSAGRVRGRWDAGVATFRAIPYAQPPVGSRRFRRPEPASPWSGERPALEPGPAAPQLCGVSAFDRCFLDPRTSEDCLWVDVWTPAPHVGADLPVVVWLHGGAFVHGTPADPLYDGALLARLGFVVVAVSYRLGALGMLDLRAHVDDGTCNLALHDQAAALTWTGENAQALGGDPERIVVCGESVGGTSVLAHVASHLPHAPRRGVALSSSPAQCLDPDTSSAIAAEVLRRGGVRRGSWEALERISLDRLLQAQSEVLGEVWGGTAGFVRERALGQLTPFLPTADDFLVRGSLIEMLHDLGPESHLLLGTNGGEAAIYPLSAEGASPTAWLSANLERSARLGDTYGDLSSVRASYDSDDKGLLAVETDRYFRAPTLAAADAAADAGAHVTLTRMDLPDRGNASHMADVCLFFGHLSSPLAAVVGLRDDASSATLAREFQDLVLGRALAEKVLSGEHVAGDPGSFVLDSSGWQFAGDADRRTRRHWRITAPRA